MTALGMQACTQLLGGIRMAFGHPYRMELFDVLQALGGSYRLVSTTACGSAVAYGRLTADFCRALLLRMMRSALISQS
jgi:hypothetical protein